YGGWAGRHPAAGYRPWDLAAGPAPHLRAFLSGGEGARPVGRRFGAGTCDRPVDHRGAPGDDRGGKRARRGSDLHGLAAAGGLSLQADDRRDLNRHAERKFAGPQRLAGVSAPLAEDFEDEVAGHVEHLRLLLETRRGTDKATQLDELFHLVERTGVLTDDRHDVE